MSADSWMKQGREALLQEGEHWAQLSEELAPFFCCAVWGELPSQASLLHPSLLHPSPSSLTNSLCQALPQAAASNYSPVPQTGEMGVRYTLCAELRKTTTVGPLFVNQIQGQNKMLSGTSWVLVIIIENCQAKEHFIDFHTYLFISLSSWHFPCSALLLSVVHKHLDSLWTAERTKVIFFWVLQTHCSQFTQKEKWTFQSNKMCFWSRKLNKINSIQTDNAFYCLGSRFINMSSQISQSQIHRYIFHQQQKIKKLDQWMVEMESMKWREKHTKVSKEKKQNKINPLK